MIMVGNREEITRLRKVEEAEPVEASAGGTDA
jgi:hypothetical protein